MPLAGTPAPDSVPGALAFRGTVLGAAHAGSGPRYGIVAIRLLAPAVNTSRPVLQWVNDLATSWNAPCILFELNAWTARYALSDGGQEATQAAYAIGSWQVVEFWITPEALGTAVAGGPSSTVARAAPIPATTGLMLGGGTSFGGPDNPADFDLAGLFLCDGVPTSDQRARLRAWARAQIPEVT
ncbi:hypothetical protein [Paracoccus aminophilus]|uniref:Uncharacterized protein n=1 Tax=Paracoccus aminophilus JCM 7686 TaxID=1367847 RepID=S5Y181_PARAH|nr:hypothetical protein [Paracoccus aminophilus]AGT09460.1 hypothetical protein JCM7686_2392 [Paracoccus aminophilus JCM 7686]